MIGPGGEAAIPLPIIGTAFGLQTLNVVRFGFPIAALLMYRKGWKIPAAIVGGYSAAVGWLPIVGVDLLGVGRPVVAVAG